MNKGFCRLNIQLPTRSTAHGIARHQTAPTRRTPSPQLSERRYDHENGLVASAVALSSKGNRFSPRLDPDHSPSQMPIGGRIVIMAPARARHVRHVRAHSGRAKTFNPAPSLIRKLIFAVNHGQPVLQTSMKGGARNFPTLSNEGQGEQHAVHALDPSALEDLRVRPLASRTDAIPGKGMNPGKRSKIR
jgi:hypothetical protein